MGKPGVMFYFDVRKCLKRLSLEEKGRLFEAILDYGEFGAVPEVDGMLGIAWDFIQPRIDMDDERYTKQVEQKQYASYSREAKRRGASVISIEKWRSLTDDERDRLISADVARYPTTATASESASTTASAANSESASATNDENRMADRPPAHTRFSSPSIDEVGAFCRKNGLTVDAERFVNYYESIGWRVGQNLMRDWKAAARSWDRKERKNEKPKPEFTWTVGTVV